METHGHNKINTAAVSAHCWHGSHTVAFSMDGFIKVLMCHLCQVAAETSSKCLASENSNSVKFKSSGVCNM